MEEWIELKKERDFNTVYSDAFAFIKQNFKALSMAFLVIGVPLLVLKNVIAGFFINNMMTGAMWLGGGLQDFGLISVVLLIIAFAAYLVIMGIVAEAYLLYERKPKTPITFNDIVNAIIKDFGRLASTYFSLVVLAFAVVVVFVIIGLIFGFLLNGVPVVGIILFFLLFAALFIVIPPFAFFSTIIYIIRLRDKDISISQAISLAYELTIFRFWTTWLVSFIALLLYMVIAGVTSIILGVLISIYTFSNASVMIDFPWWYKVLSALLDIVLNFSYIIIYGIITMWYYSLNEEKFGEGMSEQIDQIGAVDNNDTDNESPLII